MVYMFLVTYCIRQQLVLCPPSFVRCMSGRSLFSHQTFLTDVVKVSRAFTAVYHVLILLNSKLPCLIQDLAGEPRMKLKKLLQLFMISTSVWFVCIVLPILLCSDVDLQDTDQLKSFTSLYRSCKMQCWQMNAHTFLTFHIPLQYSLPCKRLKHVHVLVFLEPSVCTQANTSTHINMHTVSLKSVWCDECLFST